MSIEEHATMTGEDMYAAKSRPRKMTIEDVMAFIYELRAPSLDEEHKAIKEKIEVYAAEQVEAARKADSDLQEIMRGLDAERTGRKLHPTERLYSWEEMETHAAEQVAAALALQQEAFAQVLEARQPVTRAVSGTAIYLENGAYSARAQEE